MDRLEQGKPWTGPYIYDGDGDLIWSGSPTFDRYKVWDFRVAEFDGVDMLTGIGHRENAGVIIDNTYEWVKNVPWASDWGGSNMHEFNVVDNGTRALVFTKHDKTRTSQEMAEAVGVHKECSVMGQGVKELDITVDPPRTLFEWWGVDHIGLDETTVIPNDINNACDHDWDVHHFNSLDKFANGDYILSSRHTDTIFRISHVDGSIVWRFGGTKSDFHIPGKVRFSRQHHARILEEDSAHTVISFFDNAKGYDHNGIPSNDHSRALVVALDEKEMTSELLLEMHHPNRDFSDTRGSNQKQPNGNYFVCWSAHSRLTEHGPHGDLLMHANTKPGIGTYRGYKFQWVGMPKTPPNVYSAAFLGGEDDLQTWAYVSWNGATEVARWELFETDAEGNHARSLNKTKRRGFETDITYAGYAEFVVVQALDNSGKTIGRSEVVHTLPPVENSVLSHSTIPQLEVPSSWKDQAYDVAQDPISAFIAGVVATIVIWAVIRFARRSRARSWRSKGADYELVQNHREADGLLGSGSDHASDEGVDPREKFT